MRFAVIRSQSHLDHEHLIFGDVIGFDSFPYFKNGKVAATVSAQFGEMRVFEEGGTLTLAKTTKTGHGALEAAARITGGKAFAESDGDVFRVSCEGLSLAFFA